MQRLPGLSSLCPSGDWNMLEKTSNLQAGDDPPASKLRKFHFPFTPASSRPARIGHTVCYTAQSLNIRTLKYMYSINKMCLGFVIGAILGTASAIGSTLQSHAKISKLAAEKIALSQVQTGTIQSAELEEEHGKLIWSLDISTPSSKNITEVQVDARNGRIVSVQIETPAAQMREH